MLIQLIASGILLAAGLASSMAGRRTQQPLAKMILSRVTVTAQGSVAIIWTVYVLADLLQLLVIAAAIVWFARQVIFHSESLAVSFLLKKLG